VRWRIKPSLYPARRAQVQKRRPAVVETDGLDLARDREKNGPGHARRFEVGVERLLHPVGFTRRARS
jgi:hypothetical protein